MNPSEVMAKFRVVIIFLLLAFGQNDAARGRNKQRRQRLNKEKRQRNSESRDCFDMSKKVLRLKYERGVNASAGVIMLPTPARPTHQGISFEAPASLGTCPPRLEQDFDGDRWPRVIMNSVCECDSCYLGTRVRTMPYGPSHEDQTCPEDENPNALGYCREIMREIPVLRRAGCEGDFAKYIWEELDVAVGCECVIGSRPTTSPRPPDYGR